MIFIAGNINSNIYKRVELYVYVFCTYFIVNWYSFYNKNTTYLFPTQRRTTFLLKLFERLRALVHFFMMLVTFWIYLMQRLWLKPSPSAYDFNRMHGHFTAES